MPNIMLCGYDQRQADDLKHQIILVIRGMGLENDTVISITDMIAEACDRKHTPSPYLRICDTKRDEIDRIIRAFKAAGIREDTELLVLAGFIPKEN